MKQLFVLLTCCFLFSCFQNEKTEAAKTTIEFFVDKKGAHPKVGDKVVFRESIFHNRKAIYSSAEFGVKEIILPDTATLSDSLPLNYQLLFQMSEGDSVEIIQPLAGLASLPKDYKIEDTIKYVISLLEVIPSSNFTIEKKGASSSNYPFEFFKKTENPLIQTGDRVRYREYRYINDSLVFSTPWEKPMQAFLPARNKVPTPPPGNYAALLMCGKGDSILLSQLLTEVENLPDYVSKNDTFKYRIQVLEVLTPAEYAIQKVVKKAEAELLKIATKARKAEVEKMTLANIEKFKNDALGDDLIYTHSGLKYMIHKEGDGKMPNPTQQVEVHYAGFLMDGKCFDTTFELGEPFQFPLGMGRVILGWDEGIAKMPVGSQATLFIPYKLAYGVGGKPPKIPRRSDLVFYIEVVDAE